ncbi:hypothetical protein IW140_004290 [Coemansia sp. RSA 1813]|nr:hypothetical protein LPJ74_004172 [Coemansia sp. RSA 1843]KAJ2214845.1 hypothetical protein EV179_002655 [Coemansia sp. RSA 487]KAJ2567855.1 hypothetical protein IW140_004290 [Coemansia sp. RSA 1813]
MSKKAASSNAQQVGSRNDRTQQGQAPKPKPSTVKPVAAPTSALVTDVATAKGDQRLVSSSSSVASSLMPSPSLSPSPKPHQGSKSGGMQAKQRFNPVGTTASDIISKRIRASRKKLQRAVASEQKATATKESRENTDALAVAAAKVATLRAVVKELEELQKAVNAVDDAEKREWNNVLANEDKVHQQTLRLVYAATRCVALGDDTQRTKLEAFFELVLAGAKGGESMGPLVDEKLSMSRDNRTTAAKHLRRLAQRDRETVDGLSGSAAATYEELAGIVDQTLASNASGQAPGAATSANAPPLLREGDIQATESRDVQIPKPTSIFVSCGGVGGDSDSEDFNTTVVVPPGGLTFIASAELVDGSDSEDATDASIPQPQDTSDEQISTKDSAIEAPSMALPVPDFLLDPLGTKLSGTERVGGFAPSAGKTPADAQTNVPCEGSIADSSAINMPSPAHAPLNITGSDAPPAGFSMYGGGPPGIGVPSWLSTATGAAGAAVGATTGVPSMPGVYGMMPMHHYMPHLAAMQYGGYFPPHMYGMPEMSTIDTSSGGNGGGGGAAQPSNSDGQSVAKGEQQQLSGAVEVPSSEPTVRQQQQALAMPGMSMGGNMWQAAGVVADSSNAPTPPMMAAMQSPDSSYQHAMAAAAAAAGFSVNAPFMYPHVDATTLSTAATGGSDNNDSVNSLDSASNRGGGGSSRPSSIHHYSQQQQQQQHQVQDAAPRGLAQSMNVPEYVPITQYMWPQQHTDPKQAQQQYGNYGYPQQQYHQNHSGGQGSGGYRGRDSGSTNSGSTASGNSNNSGGGSGHYHQHYNYQRDRRSSNNNSGGNGGGEYQRQRRWNNNNNNNSGGGGQQGYNRQHHHHHHNAHSSAVAQAPQPPVSSAASSYSAAGGSQNQNENTVGGYGVQAGDVPPVAASGNPAPQAAAAAAASYYGNTFVRQ